MTAPKSLPQILLLDNVIPQVFELLQGEFHGEFEVVQANLKDQQILLSQIAQTDFILAISEKVTGEMIQAGKKLKMIHKWGVGYDKFDLKTARAKGVLVAVTTGVNSSAVAEWAVLNMLALYRQLLKADHEVKSGRWPKWELRLNNYELRGKTVGIIGFGSIGRFVAHKLKGFETETYYYDPIVVTTPAEEKELGVKGCLALDTLFPKCDIITIHCLLNDQTRNLINADRLKTMKKTAIIINASRGQVVDEEALYEALKNGVIAGAALDVFNQEPVDPNNPLLKLPNVLVSPHVASATMDTLKYMANRVYSNMKQVVAGKPVEDIYLIK